MNEQLLNKITQKLQYAGEEELYRVLSAIDCQDNLFFLGHEHKIFQVGNQLWSEDLFIPEIGIKISFVDTLFTWYHLAAIEKLLPINWRIPSKDDFVTLDKFLENDPKNYINAWRGRFNGRYNTSNHNGLHAEQHELACYWSRTDTTRCSAYYLSFGYEKVYPYPGHYEKFARDKHIGMSVRCIRDIVI
jgi:uncharacterized protein (TIGR02145 family)